MMNFWMFFVWDCYMMLILAFRRFISSYEHHDFWISAKNGSDDDVRQRMRLWLEKLQKTSCFGGLKTYLVSGLKPSEQ